MHTLAWSGFLIAGTGALALAQHHPPQHGAGGGDAASIFKSQCMSCHVVPDPKFEADRAYIRQIYDTA